MVVVFAKIFALLCVLLLYGISPSTQAAPPDVHMFAIRYIKYKTRLKLTCMVTGFYHKDLMMNIRKYRASLPENEIKSTGIRPNHDGSFQMKKSVEIKEGDERAVYYCWVLHKSLKEPIINIWDGKCWDCPPEIPTGAVIVAVIGAVIVAELVLAAFGFLVFKRINGRENTGEISDVNVTSSQEDLYPLESEVHERNRPTLVHLQETKVPGPPHSFYQVPAEKMVFQTCASEQLLEILDYLESDNLKRFKWYLKQRGLVPASLIENADNTDVVDQMVNRFTPDGALMLTVKILKEMNQKHLSEQLIHYLNSDENIYKYKYKF
ncbi:uncharacterized protein LOC125242959 isoform X2 [Megalobrama amblycephala]|uniref:uncharacterized protein LOC125242959 isoform X2 n=1 Tax=Megalobrama amblycephala TaxID=75352 RepID=UPI0020144DBC|nr:uncharacterized protein LOC125242959 isoform X2 [Megalobrama amblycephala]